MLFTGACTGVDEVLSLNTRLTDDSGTGRDDSASGTGGAEIDEEPDKAVDGDMSDTGGDQSSTSSDEVIELDTSESDKAVDADRDMLPPSTGVIKEAAGEVAGKIGKSPKILSKRTCPGKKYRKIFFKLDSQTFQRAIYRSREQWFGWRPKHW